MSPDQETPEKFVARVRAIRGVTLRSGHLDSALDRLEEARVLLDIILANAPLVALVLEDGELTSVQRLVSPFLNGYGEGAG